MFISHAKLDGSPIALALKSQIESLPFLQRFYDAQDILPGTRWRKVLENGIKKSVLVVLRTDVYERRAWCVQELEWGEEYGGPAIIIDVRSALAMPRESLQHAVELSQIGYNPEDVKNATIRLCESLLSAGARLVFGDDWRPDGVMDAICRIAVKYQQPIEGKKSPKPLSQSLVTWPHEPSLDSEFLRDLEQRGVLKVETVRLPSDSDWSRPNDPIARAIALTAMRREMTTRTNARVCLGGSLLV